MPHPSRLHAFGAEIEEALDDRAAVLHRQLEPTAEEPVGRLPLPQRPPIASRLRVLPPRLRPLRARHLLQIQRRRALRGRGDLRIGALVGQLRGRRQLLRAERTVQCRATQMRQPLQLAGDVTLTLRVRLGHTITRGLVLRQRIALVEHPQRRQRPGLVPTRRAQRALAELDQPIGVPTPEFVAQLTEAVHEPIQTEGYDSYRPNRTVTPKIFLPRSAPPRAPSARSTSRSQPARRRTTRPRTRRP